MDAVRVMEEEDQQGTLMELSEEEMKIYFRMTYLMMRVQMEVVNLVRNYNFLHQFRVGQVGKGRGHGFRGGNRLIFFSYVCILGCLAFAWMDGFVRSFEILPLYYNSLGI